MHFKCFLAAEARREIFGRSLRFKAQRELVPQTASAVGPLRPFQGASWSR